MEHYQPDATADYVGSVDRAGAAQSSARQNKGIARLPAADILRGLAALWVFLFHASEGHHIDTLFRALPQGISTALFSAGHLGVPVFFVLSGLVIAMTGEHCGDGLGAAARFFARRLVRLAPPYYVSLGIGIAFLLLKQRVEAKGVVLPEPTAIFLHLLFLQNLLGIPALNSVYWTLCIEVQFYVMFCALMLLARWLGRGRFGAYGWLCVMGTAGVVAALWPFGLADDTVWRASFLPTWHLFLLGVLLHHALRGGRFAAVPYVAYLVALAVAAIVFRNVFTLAGVATSAVLYFLSRWPSETSWRSFRPLTTLGLVSYSFYLLHNPITGAAFNVVRRLAGNGIAAELAGLIVSFCLCVFAAGLSYIAIERPTIKWGRRFGN